MIGLLMATALAAPAATSGYAVIRKEIVIERSADVVWKRVGADYCAIGEWLKVKCTLDSGDGGLGSVRRINDVIVEPMVGQTERSYTYGQTKGPTAEYDYHGTIAVEPVAEARSKIVYTLVYDAVAMPSDQVRKDQHDRIDARFQAAVETMKTMIEAEPK